MPKELLPSGKLGEIQQHLLSKDHFIVGLPYQNAGNIAKQATASASSELVLSACKESIGKLQLTINRLQMFPVVTDRIDHVSVLLDVERAGLLEYEIYSGPTNNSTFPDQLLATLSVELQAGEQQWVQLPVNIAATRKGWYFVVLNKQPDVSIHFTNQAPVGLKMMDSTLPHPIHKNRNWLFNRSLAAAYQAWCFQISPQQAAYSAHNVLNEWDRPFGTPCLWASQSTDFTRPEWLKLAWSEPQAITSIQLLLDSSLDVNLYPIAYAGTSVESDPRHTIASIIKDYRIQIQKPGSQEWDTLEEVSGNYLRNRTHRFAEINAVAIRIEVLATQGMDRAQIYAVRVNS
jgi:hypothetical protein